MHEAEHQHYGSDFSAEHFKNRGCGHDFKSELQEQRNESEVDEIKTHDKQVVFYLINFGFGRILRAFADW